MPEIKTQPTDVDPRDFLARVPNDRRREDSLRLLELMERVTGQDAVMWGPSMVGFGELEYQYATGHGGRTFRVGFAPRAQALTVYGIWFEGAPLPDDVLAGLEDLIGRLGPHTTSKACVYIKRLDQVDLQVLEELVRIGYQYMGDVLNA